MAVEIEPGQWAARMAASTIARHPAAWAERWVYEWGLVLKAILALWDVTREPAYLDYVRASVDRLVGPDGSIRTYRPDEYNLDHINPGKVLLPLYAITGDTRYAAAAGRLRAQLRSHPRTASGGFWHKQIYPHQMWLDGIYMAAPFLAAYAAAFDEPALFDDIAHQIMLIEGATRDPATGLLYHAWDESRQQAWAHPESGCSPHFWGRAMGWFVMALPDVLEFFPVDHPARAALVAVLARTATAVAQVQDPATGLWYQVLDHPGRPGNYLEASASCMFVYGMAKGVRLGCLPPRWLATAQAGFQGVVERLVAVDEAGQVTLNQICAVAGLGGTPYRDGSYEYYIGEPVVSNDFKGVGPFILAGVELKRVQERAMERSES